MTKRPTTYVEWRALYQGTLMSLGLVTVSLESMRRLKMPDCIKQQAIRSYWKKIYRLKRIDARMEIEREAKDSTYIDAMLEVFDDEDEE